MLTKADMMGVLIAACPEFAPQWEAFEDEWAETDDMPLYLILFEFACNLIGMLKRGEMARFSAVFAAVEKLHVEGDDYVREAATVGLLEDLQNHNLHSQGTDPEQFRPYLGPVSAHWWDKLVRLWQHGEMLTDDSSFSLQNPD